MSEIAIEFSRAKANGWLPMFVSAGASYGFSAALLMALASRETNMKNIEGDFRSDGPHGFGLMQIDKGSYPLFCSSGQWENVEASIAMGARVLASKQLEIQQGTGKAHSIGKWSFVGAELDDAALNRCAVAAYNAGLWAYYGQSVHGNPDLFTTGHNYSADVIERLQQFQSLLAAEPVS